MKKLGMRSAGKVSKIWKKLNSEGISVKSLLITNGKAGFITISDEEVKEYVNSLSKEQKEEFEMYSEDIQKRLIAKIKEDEKKVESQATLIDSVLANYYLIENELLEIISMASEKTIDELELMSLDEYIAIAYDVMKENMDFFTSVAKLKVKQ